MMKKMWLMFMVAGVFSILFVYIYFRGFVGNNIWAGVKAFVMSLVQPFIASMRQYTIYPLPFSLAVQWYIFGLIQFILCGIAVASVFKNNSN